MSKKIVAILMAAIILTGCHGAARNYGGSMTLELPKGQKLEEITWKDDTEWGVFEGTVTIIESR